MGWWHLMNARPSSGSPADSFGSSSCAEISGLVSGLLARCEALRSELDALRIVQGDLFRMAEDTRRDCEGDRQRRARGTMATLSLLSAVAELRLPALTVAVVPPRAPAVPTVPPSHGRAA